MACGLLTAFPSAAAADAPLPASVTPTAPDPIAEARTAYQREPTSAFLGRSLLDALVRSGQVEAAKRLVFELTQRFPDDAQLWAQTGYLQFSLREFKHAQAAFGRALVGGEWLPDQRRNLAFAEADSALAAGDPAGAVAALLALCVVAASAAARAARRAAQGDLLREFG